METKLTTEMVRKIEHKHILDMTLMDTPDEDAMKTLWYIDGINTMADLIIKTIEELG